MARKPLDRREFLKLGAGAALLAACGGESDGAGAGADAAPPDAIAPDGGVADALAPDGGAADALAPDAAVAVEDAALFPTAVLAGDMRPDRVLVRGRTTLDEPVTLRLFADNFDALDLVSETPVTPAEGHLAAELEGLDAGTTYHFAFFAGGRRSPMGRFRTPPAAGTLEAVTFAATACTNSANTPYRTLSLAAERGADALLHLGDMSYNDGAETREEFRRKWETTLKDPGYRDVFAKMGLYATWDDHEISNNNLIDGLPHNGELTAESRAAGIEAFFEALPVGRTGARSLYRSFRWGDSVEVFVLDCRGERIYTDEGLQQYVSPEQMAWIKAGLSASPCHFKVVLNSVPILRFPPDLGFENDRWQGCPSQRDELLDHITSNDIRNVWFLSGDLHFGAVARVEVDGPRRRMRDILCGPGASSYNPLKLFYDRDPASVERFFPPAQFSHLNFVHAATLLRFEPDANRVQVTFLAADGSTLYDAALGEDDA